MLRRVLGALLDDLVVGVEEVVAAHPRLAGDAGGDDDDVGPGGVLVVVRPEDARVGALDRRRLHDVEALALGHALDDVDEDDVGQLAVGDPLRQRRPHVPGPDHGDFPVHEALSSGAILLPPARARIETARQGGFIPCPTSTSRCRPTAPRSPIRDGKLHVPDRPIVPFIEGDGTGPDIWRASVRVLDAAVAKAYGGRRKIAWMEVYAGEKAFKQLDNWLPDETVEAFREFLVGIKGPLTTPIGGGIRSLNVALRQLLDLYVCLRPVRWFVGVPSPVKHPEKVDMVIFRENTEDIYAGIEFESGTEDAKKVLAFLKENFPKAYAKIRFPGTTAIGIKPVSAEGSERLIRAAIEYALANKRKSLTLVHKGNIMKFTEGAFRNWGYALAEREFARPGLHLGPVGAHEEGEGRGGGQRRAEGGPRLRASSWSRTRSPTSRCSRC